MEYEDVQECVQDCLDAHRACEETLQHCLRKGGVHAEGGHIRSLEDCAQCCMTAADFLLRDSELQIDVCEVAALACDAAARSCDQIADDYLMKRCVQTCRKTADSLRMNGQEIAGGFDFAEQEA